MSKNEAREKLREIQTKASNLQLVAECQGQPWVDFARHLEEILHETDKAFQTLALMD